MTDPKFAVGDRVEIVKGLNRGMHPTIRVLTPDGVIVTYGDENHLKWFWLDEIKK